MSDDLVKRYRQLQEVIGGCHDGYCVVRKPKGMHTNGGCNCLEDLRLHERSRIGHLLRCAQGMADRIEELEAKLAKAVGLLEAWINVATHCTIKEGVCCCGDNMDTHAEPMHCGHSPVDHGAYIAESLVEKTNTTLAELTGGKDE